MDSKEKLSLSEQIRQEAGLPENFEAIDAPPIIPSAGGAQNSGDRFLEGSLPQYAQLPTDFAKTASKSLTAPNLSLMPLGPNASANNNAATESIIEQASEIATAAATEAAVSIPGDMIWNGSWISFAVYDVDDVVLYNNSAWIALQANTSKQPDINPTQWQLLAKYSGGVNAQTGTTYTFLPSDNAQLVTFTNAAAIAVGLPVASTAGFNSGWYVDVQNIGAVGNGWVTITPTTSTIDGLASVTVQCGSGLRIFSDGTNYFTSRGAANLTLDNLSDFWPGREAQFFRTAEFTTGVCIDNACFEASTTMVSGAPPGWYNTYLSSGFQPLTFNTATPYIGDRSLQINGISGISGGGCAQNRVLTVMPGETYQISGWIKTDGTVQGNIDLVFTNYPITTASVITASSTASSWTYVVASGTVPTGAGSGGYCLGILQLVTVSGTSGSFCSFDDIRIHRIFGASGASSSPGMVPDPGSSAGSTRYLREDGSWQVPPGGSGGGGTVTSVAMTVPSWLTVAGSPITGGGSLDVTATGGLTQNSVLATPDGLNGALSVRALVTDDILSAASGLTLDDLSDAYVGGTYPRSAAFLRPAQFSNLLVDNSDFEASTALINGAPPGWFAYPSLTAASYNTATPQSGTQSLEITGTGNGIFSNRATSVVVGETYQISGWIQTDGTCTGEIIWQPQAADFSGVYGSATASSSASSWTYVSATATITAGGVVSQAICVVTSGTAGSVCSFDNIRVQRIFGASGANSQPGAVPDPGASAGTTHYLREDASWQQLAFSDISGSVAASQLPNPTASTLGGIESIAASTHKWINAISTAGVPSQTQPDFSDLSGDATTAQILTAAGGLTLADLASPYLANNVPLSSVTTGAATAPLIGILSDNSVSMYGYGGDQAISAVDGAVYAFDGSGNRAGAFSETNLLADITSGTALSVDTLFANTVDAISGFEVNGSPLNFTNIAGSVAASQLPNPTATTLGGIESIAATSHKWIDSISTSGVPHQSQPAFTDISGAASTGQIPNLPASIITSGQLALARGGTDADLSATGGTSKVLRQSSTGAAITVSQLGYSDLSGNPENLNVGTSGASAVPLTVTAAASQTADVLDLDDSSGTPQIAASFDASATFPFTGDPTRGFVFAKPASGARKAFIGVGDEASSGTTWINQSFDLASGLSSSIACGEGLAIYPVLSSADLFHECFPPSGGWALFGANGGEGLALFAQNGGPVRIYSGGLASGNLCAEFPTSGGLSVTGSFVLNGSGGTSRVLKQTSSGAAITVAQLAFTDISGSVAAAQLPNPTASTLGGIESIAATTHEWVDSVSTSGVPHQSQPAFSDISGTATVAQMPTSVLDFSIAAFAPGLGIANQTLTRIALAQSVTFPSGASGSYAISDVLATGSTTYTLSKNGTPFATVVFTSSSLIGTWTQASSVTFSAGDILKIAGPSSPDSSLSDVGITLAGTKN